MNAARVHLNHTASREDYKIVWFRVYHTNISRSKRVFRGARVILCSYCKGALDQFQISKSISEQRDL